MVQMRSPVCWAVVGDAQLTGPEIVVRQQRRLSQIKHRLQASRDRQKLYAVKRRISHLEFLAEPRYIRIILNSAKSGIGLHIDWSYHRELIAVFFVPFTSQNLRSGLSIETLAIPVTKSTLMEKLHFIEEPVEIMDCEVKFTEEQTGKKQRTVTVRVPALGGHTMASDWIAVNVLSKTMAENSVSKSMGWSSLSS
ncbi:hypothetical protein Tco_0817288 [Tanacetum coccineum]